jgi:hypothetical protein
VVGRGQGVEAVVVVVVVIVVEIWRREACV